MKISRELTPCSGRPASRHADTSSSLQLQTFDIMTCGQEGNATPAINFDWICFKHTHLRCGTAHTLDTLRITFLPPIKLSGSASYTCCIECCYNVMLTISPTQNARGKWMAAALRYYHLPRPFSIQPAWNCVYWILKHSKIKTLNNIFGYIMTSSTTFIYSIVAKLILSFAFILN